MSLAFAVNVLDIQDSITMNNESAFNITVMFLLPAQNHLNRPRSVREETVSSLIQIRLFVISFTIALTAKLSKLRVPLDCTSMNIVARVCGLTALVEK